MSEVIIEIYTDAYKKAVADLIIQIQNEEFGIPITIDQQPDLKDITHFYQANRGNFWVAKNDNTVIGTIALLDIGNNQAALRKMFVAPLYRGKEFGIAQKLLASLFSWTKEKDIAEIFLGTTEKFLRAQKFYEKNGFIEVNKNDLPAKFPIMDVDVKFYKISFANSN